MCPTLEPLAEGSDVFVADCSCWDEHCGVHMSPKDILTLRERVAASTRFVVTHIGAGQAPAAIHDAGILVAEDLQTLKF